VIQAQAFQRRAAVHCESLAPRSKKQKKKEEDKMIGETVDFTGYCLSGKEGLGDIPPKRPISNRRCCRLEFAVTACKQRTACVSNRRKSAIYSFLQNTFRSGNAGSNPLISNRNTPRLETDLTTSRINTRAISNRNKTQLFTTRNSQPVALQEREPRPIKHARSRGELQIRLRQPNGAAQVPGEGSLGDHTGSRVFCYVAVKAASHRERATEDLSVTRSRDIHHSQTQRGGATFVRRIGSTRRDEARVSRMLNRLGNGDIMRASARNKLERGVQLIDETNRNASRFRGHEGNFSSILRRYT
jgi:hypothetical protein